jgi:N-hydroxyarylamine O-acetyltransferase
MRFLADAGLGEGPLDPVALIDGSQTAGPLPWTVEELADGGFRLGQHPYGSVAGFSFLGRPAELADFDPHHRRLATSPESSFVQTLVVQQPDADRIVTLRARTLAVDGPGVRTRLVLEDAGAFAATLRDTFGIDPDALGTGRLTRLWSRASAQHERHVSNAR